jgi:hypothetical protein
MPFQPGNQIGNLGNRSGIPKRPRIVTQRLIAILNETDEDNIPKLHRLASALYNRAIEGDVAAIKEVIDRVEGKVPQPIAGDPDNPLVVASVIREIVDPQSNVIALPDASSSRAS